MLPLFLSMFVFGGASLLALLWFGSVDEASAESAPTTGVLGDAAALLTVCGALAAMTGAGASGALVLGVLRLPAALAWPVAVLGALVGAAVWRRALRAMRTFDRDHAVPTAVLVGREGTLTVGIGGLEAPGVVQLTLGGLSQEFTALPEDQQQHAAGSRVVVVRVLSDRAVAVEASPYPAPSLSP